MTVRVPFRAPAATAFRRSGRRPWFDAVTPLTPDDVLALRAWWRFEEGSGTALVDWLHAQTNGDRGVADLTATVGATGAWDVSGAFRVSGGATPTFARTGNLPASVRALGTGPLIVEFDATYPSPIATAGVLVTAGRATSQTNMGWEWTLSNSIGVNPPAAAGRVLFKASGAGGVGPAVSYLQTPAIAGGRHHMAIVWDRDANDTTGEVQLWVNGSLVDEIRVFAVTTPSAGAPIGSVTIPASGTRVSQLAIGNDIATATPTSGPAFVVHNCRIWHPVEIPSNLAAIMDQAASKPDTLPRLMAGVQ